MSIQNIKTTLTIKGLEAPGIMKMSNLRSMTNKLFGSKIPYSPEQQELMKGLKLPSIGTHEKVTVLVDNLPQSGSYGAALRMVEIIFKDLGPVYLKYKADYGDGPEQRVILSATSPSEESAGSIPNIPSDYQLVEGDIEAVVKATLAYGNSWYYELYHPLVKSARQNPDGMNYWMTSGNTPAYWSVEMQTNRIVEKVNIISGVSGRYSTSGDLTIKYDNEIAYHKVKAFNGLYPSDYNAVLDTDLAEIVITGDE